MIIPPARRLAHLKEYYFSVKLQQIRQMQEAGCDVINMGIGSPDLMPSDATIETLCQSAQQPGNHGYQPYQGIPALRKAIAAWYQQTYAVLLNPETEVLPLMGSKEGITHVALTFLNPGDEMLIPELGYPAYRAVADMVEAKVRTYPLREDDWQPDWQAMQQEDYSQVKLMWLNYPHMPTGVPPRREVFEQMVDFAKEKQILLCHDNPYSLVLNTGKPLSLLAVPGAKEVAIELNSLSKSHNMAGWRVGWIAGTQAYLNEIIKVKSNIDSGMFRPVQEAAIRALQNPESWHEARNQVYRERRDVVYQLLDALHCRYQPQQQGLFVWAKLPDNAHSAEHFVDNILQKFHVFITPGFIFGQKGERFIRISLCNSKERLTEALERLSSPNLGAKVLKC